MIYVNNASHSAFFNIPHSISPPTYDAQNARKRSEKPAFFQYKSMIKVELTAVRVGL